MKVERNKRRARILKALLLLLTTINAAILIDSNTRIVTTGYELSFANLPAGFDGYRIVVLSDIHASQYGEDNARLLKMVGDAKPDMIAITGDLIDRHKIKPAEKQLAVAETLASGLTQIAPVYFVTGNHDWGSGQLRTLMAILAENGVHVLRNEYTVLESGGDRITLVGLDDPNGPADMIKPDGLMRRVRSLTGDGFTILLEHRNYNLKRNSELRLDLVLSGHAHGGIIRLPFTDGLVGPQRDLFPTYTNGLYEMGGTSMLVSRGIGNNTGLLRFLNNPEVVVVVLRRM